MGRGSLNIINSEEQLMSLYSEIEVWVITLQAASSHGTPTILAS